MKTLSTNDQLLIKAFDKELKKLDYDETNFDRETLRKAIFIADIYGEDAIYVYSFKLKIMVSDYLKRRELMKMYNKSKKIEYRLEQMKKEIQIIIE